jgi:transposase-like protein
MTEQDNSPKHPSPIKAVHNTRGEVTIRNIQKIGHRYSFVCETRKGCPKTLLAEQRYWKSDISEILRAYEPFMPAACKLEPRIVAHSSADEYQSAQQWFRSHGKSLPRIISHDQYEAWVRRASKKAAERSLGSGVACDDFDQETLVDTLLAGPSSDERPSPTTGDGQEAESNQKWDEATVEERAGAEEEHYLGNSSANNTGFDRAFSSVLANSRIRQRKEKSSGADSEKLTPIQRLVRSQMGDCLEMYFLSQEGQSCKEIAPKFVKLRKPKPSGPKSWPQLISCTPGDVRRAVEYVKSWADTLPREGSILATAQEELQNLNRQAAWSALSQLLPAPHKEKETEIDLGKRRGKEWDSIEHIFVSSPEKSAFVTSEYLAALLHKSRRSYERESPVPEPMSAEDRARFLQGVSDQAGLGIRYWVENGRVRNSAENLLTPRFKQRNQKEIPSVFRTEPEPILVPYVKPKCLSAPDARDRKKARLRQIESGLIALLDGPTKISNREKARLIAVADRLQSGDSVQQIASRLRVSKTKVERIVRKLKSAAAVAARPESKSARKETLPASVPGAMLSPDPDCSFSVQGG